MASCLKKGYLDIVSISDMCGHSQCLFLRLQFDTFYVVKFDNFIQSTWRHLVLLAWEISWASQAARSTEALRGLRRRDQPTSSLDDQSVMVAGAKVPTHGTDPETKGPTVHTLQLVP